MSEQPLDRTDDPQSSSGISPTGPMLTGLPSDLMGTSGVARGLIGVSIQQGGANDALVSRMNRDQISKIIQQTDDADRRAHERIMETKKNEKTIVLALIVAIAVTLLGLAWIFLYYKSGQELRDIISPLVGAGIGGAGGYGVGTARAHKKDG